MLKNISYFAMANTFVFALKFISIPFIARLTTPEDFGAIAFMVLVASLVNIIFGKACFTASLTSKYDLTIESWSTALYFNLLVGSLIYILTVYGLKYAVVLFHVSIKEYVFVIFFTVIPLYFVNDVFSGRLHVGELYKTDSSFTVISELLGLFSCFCFILNGFGVEGLVAQHIISAFARFTLLFIFVFSRDSASE